MCSTNRLLRALATAAVFAAAGCAREVGAPLIEGRVDAVAPAWNLAVQAGLPLDPEVLLALAWDFAEAAPPAVLFGFDRAALDPAALAALDAQAAWLRTHPRAVARITGHADLPGSSNYNRRLGLLRAQAVAGALIARGVSPERLVVASAGEAAPLVPVPDRAPLNRRAVTEIAWVGRAPQGFPMDGQRALAVYDAWRRLAAAPLAAASSPGP